MRKLANTVLFCAVTIELLASMVAGFAHVAWMRLPWFAAHPFPYVAHLSFVSAFLWGVFALRLVWRGPVLVMFSVREPKFHAFIVAPVYPEDVMGGANAVVMPLQNIAPKPKDPGEKERDGPPAD